MVKKLLFFMIQTFAISIFAAGDSLEQMQNRAIQERCGEVLDSDQGYYCAEQVRQQVVEEQAAVYKRQQESANAQTEAQARAAASQAEGSAAICEEATKKAAENCDFSKNKETRMAIAMADQMRNQIKGMSMSSPVLMCSKMGQVTQSIDLAVGSYKTYCSSSYADCDDVCSDQISKLENQIKVTKAQPNSAPLVQKLEEEMKRAEDQNRKCQKLANNVKGVFENIGSYSAIEAAKSQYCKDQGDALAALCKAQPSNALCQGAGSTDCSNPTTAANNIVCICQVNKADPRCTGQALAGLNSAFSNKPGAGADGGSSAGKVGADDFGIGGGFGAGGEPVAGVGPQNDGSGGPPQSKGQPGRGGPLDVGGSANQGQQKANPNGAAGAGHDPINAKIINGYGYGGNSAGGAKYYGSGSGSSSASNGYYNGRPLAGAPQVDLRKFLPGGKMDPSRGLAGIAGPDGITGPNTDI